MYIVHISFTKQSKIYNVIYSSLTHPALPNHPSPCPPLHSAKELPFKKNIGGGGHASIPYLNFGKNLDLITNPKYASEPPLLR